MKSHIQLYYQYDISMSSSHRFINPNDLELETLLIWSLFTYTSINVTLIEGWEFLTRSNNHDLSLSDI